MAPFLFQRFLQSLGVLFGVSILVFVLVRLLPGDPALAMAGEHAKPETVEAIRNRWGFDRPVWIQYGRYLKRVLQGDLGRSIHSQTEVRREILDRFPATIELALAALLLAVAAGIGIGVASALFADRWIDRLGTFAALIGVSMPVFWLGYCLILLRLAWGWEWLGFVGRMGELTEVSQLHTSFYLIESLCRGLLGLFSEGLSYILLPALALSTIPMAVVARFTRGSLLDVLGHDYIRTARAKGCSWSRTALVHGLKNAALPILTLTGMQTAYLFGGAVLTETVFSWPGLGRYLYEAVPKRDYPVIQGVLLLFAGTFVGVNLLVDCCYAWLDPRVRQTLLAPEQEA
jgi:peptide/nickel transport system permease protein